MRAEAGRTGRLTAITSSNDPFLFPLVAVPLIYWRHTKSQLEKERLKKMRRDLREAVLAAVLLASGMWMIVSGLMKLWGE
jgi:hypothetical protein